MGRPSVQREIIKWLHEAISKRYVIKRQFYTSAQLYTLNNNTTCDNHIKSDQINKFKVKVFTTHLNNTLKYSLTPKCFKSRFKRETGYQYIFLYDQEMIQDISELRLSNRIK